MAEARMTVSLVIALVYWLPGVVYWFRRLMRGFIREDTSDYTTSLALGDFVMEILFAAVCGLFLGAFWLPGYLARMVFAGLDTLDKRLSGPPVEKFARVLAGETPERKIQRLEQEKAELLRTNCAMARELGFNTDEYDE